MDGGAGTSSKRSGAPCTHCVVVGSEAFWPQPTALPHIWLPATLLALAAHTRHLSSFPKLPNGLLQDMLMQHHGDFSGSFLGQMLKDLPSCACVRQNLLPLVHSLVYCPLLKTPEISYLMLQYLCQVLLTWNCQYMLIFFKVIANSQMRGRKGCFAPDKLFGHSYLQNVPTEFMLMKL